MHMFLDNILWGFGLILILYGWGYNSLNVYFVITVNIPTLLLFIGLLNLFQSSMPRDALISLGNST